MYKESTALWVFLDRVMHYSQYKKIEIIWNVFNYNTQMAESNGLQIG